MSILFIPDVIVCKIISCWFCITSITKFETALTNHSSRDHIFQNIYTKAAFKIPKCKFKIASELKSLPWVVFRGFFVKCYSFEIHFMEDLTMGLSQVRPLWPAIFNRVLTFSVFGRYQPFAGLIEKVVNSCANLENFYYENCYKNSSKDQLWWLKIDINILVKLRSIHIHEIFSSSVFNEPFLLADITKHCNFLSYLSLKCDLSCSGMHFQGAIRSNAPTLTSLHLADCMINGEFLILVTNVLSRSLRKLHLENCYDLSPEESRIYIDANLLSCFSKCNVLDYIEVSLCQDFKVGSKLQSFSFQELSFHHMKGVTNRALYLDSVEKSMIQAAFKLFPDLNDLAFDNIDFEDDDIMNSLIESNPNLRVISFEDCASLRANTLCRIVEQNAIVAVQIIGCDSSLTVDDIMLILCQKNKTNLLVVAIGSRSDFKFSHMVNIVAQHLQLKCILVTACCPSILGVRNKDLLIAKAQLKNCRVGLKVAIYDSNTHLLSISSAFMQALYM
jgi:hypothetical protein